MIKLICSDIDGTLLPEGTAEINPEIFAVIRKLKEKDIIFAAASGRPYSSIVRLFEPVKNDIIFVSENGAYVSCRGYLMSEEVIDWKDVCEWVEEVRKIPGASLALDADGGLYSESTDQEFVDLIRLGYHSRLTIVEDVLAEERHINKISVYRKNDIEKVAEDMVPRWSRRLHCTIAGDIWLDFMSKESNKGHAIREIQKILRISPDETMVFGDNLNDIEMLQSAGVSYAVANAREEVRAAATDICAPYWENGVLQILKGML